MNEVYYKATKARGVSGYDRTFVYHLGLNVHPSPDKNGDRICSDGIHLAKSIEVAQRFVRHWKEIYEAKAGVIISEDNEKIRCSHCFLTRLIMTRTCRLPLKPSLCDDWVGKHRFDITMMDIEGQTLEIIRDNKTPVALTVGMKSKRRKQVIKAVIEEAIQE